MLEVKNLSKTFSPGTVNEVRALQGVDFTLAEGGVQRHYRHQRLGEKHRPERHRGHLPTR